MFDSKFTDYKITGKDCPYSKNKNADITKGLYDAFRKEGLGITLYYSKPNWHNNDFWIKDQPKPSRNTNYDVNQDKERWERYVQFTHNQINQLLSEYGKIDVLWLDGGWVNPNNKNQNIRMDEIAANGRKKQPGLLVVDRTIHGEFENFITPEQTIPKEAILYPWETCMTLGRIWGHSSGDYQNYKPTSVIISKLIEVVAKGGNFLFNIGARSDGSFDPQAVKQIGEIGDWMDVNGEAIYATRAIAPYLEGNIYYTRKKNTNDVYAICLANEKQTEIPAEVVVPSFQPKAGSKVTLLGSKTALKWTRSGKGTTITIPENLRKNPPSKYAWAFKITIK
jgi:alpha-L-fucosidase